MPPEEHTPEDLATFRLHQARVSLQAALAALDFQTAANRSYYCIFYAMRAVQALDRFDSRKHSGVIDNFRKNYIRTEIFSHDFSDIIGDAFKIRLESDYEDFYLISKEEVAAQVENAKTFLEAMEKYIGERIHK
ncbi:MAG: HEPN domain-containing protein [Chitinispirillales bacterium]|jgi:uncharacterized protein (UPF0332 family)|nr:HEPN domain-containing protein [Chitinispirillales bacterium]